MRGPLARIPTALALLLLVTGATLGLGLLFKDLCNHHVWDGYQYRALCYSDITPLYAGRHFDDDTFPYLEHPGEDPPGTPLDRRHGFVEYPALTGLFMWTAAILGTLRHNLGGPPESYQEFFYWNAAMLIPLALAVTFFLWRSAPEPRRVAYWAAGTPLFLYAFHNWDLLPVFFLVLTLFLWERRRFAWSGLALAAGTSAKLYPLVVAPILLLLAARALYDRHHAQDPVGVRAAATDGLRFAVALAGGLALVNLPFFLASPEMFLETYRYHARREANFESIWWALHFLGDRVENARLAEANGRTFVQAVGGALFGAGYAGVALLAWFRRWGPREASLSVLLLFLIFNKIFSVQYALWVLPFFALLRLPAWLFGLYAAADAFVYLTLFPSFVHLIRPLAPGNPLDNPDFIRAYTPAAWAVIARTATLALLLAWVAWATSKVPHPYRDAGR